MEKRNIFLPSLFILLFVTAVNVSATIFKTNFLGSLESKGAEIAICAYSEGWQLMSVRGSWKECNVEERKFQLVQNGVGFFEGRCVWKTVGTEIEGDIQMQCTKSIMMQSLSVALQIPLHANRGKQWMADGTVFVIPHTGIRHGNLTQCTVPLPLGRTLTMRFDKPMDYTEQNMSQWFDSWALRFGPDQELRQFEVGDRVAFHFSLSASDGLEMKQFNEQVTLREGDDWVRLSNSKDIEAGSALDFSNQNLQQAPAGRYGWLKTHGGTFEFEKRPGKPCRFYGVNLCFSANYPTHEEADKLTDRLVRLGYNSIRVHHHDDTWDKGDADKLDKLDYLLACAMKKGLYVTTDMYVSRSVLWKQLGVDKEGNVGMDLFKTLVGCYEPAYQNWCDFAQRFMEHLNPYTGRKYKDEAGMPLISLINEGGLSMGFSSKAAEPIVQQAYRKFSGKDGKLTHECEDFDEFYDWLEKRIARRCTGFLRNLGCKALITNDNNGYRHGDGESATSLYDYVDNHFYIDHPRFLDRNWALPSSCDNVNPVTYGGPGTFKKHYAKGFSKPYTITEWNFSGPGRYRGLGGILTGALASVQEWDGLWRFAYAHSRESLTDNPDHAPGYFDVATDPLSQASDRASICLFLRGDAMDEKELAMDNETGVLRLSTKRTCGIFASEGKHSAGILTTEISGAPATVCLTSLDGKGLETSRHMLLSHITDIQGDGTMYADEERKILLKWGQGALIEKGEAKITISATKPKKCEVYALDTSGRRTERIPYELTKDGISFTVSTHSGDGQGRIYYEIVR